MLLLRMAQLVSYKPYKYTTEKHQLGKEPLPKLTTVYFVIKFAFCYLLLSGS